MIQTLSCSLVIKPSDIDDDSYKFREDFYNSSLKELLEKCDQLKNARFLEARDMTPIKYKIYIEEENKEFVYAIYCNAFANTIEHIVLIDYVIEDK